MSKEPVIPGTNARWLCKVNIRHRAGARIARAQEPTTGTEALMAGDGIWMAGFQVKGLVAGEEIREERVSFGELWLRRLYFCRGF